MEMSLVTSAPTAHLLERVRARMLHRCLLILLLVGFQPASWSHPFLNNTWQVLAESNRLAMRVTATLREVSVIQGLPLDRLKDLPALQNAASNHADYVSSHLRVELGGHLLPIEILDHQLLLDSSSEPEDSATYPDQTHVAYDLECRLPESATNGTVQVRFGHRTLEGHSYAPGIAWDPFYVLLVADRDRRSLGQGVVRMGSPVAVMIPVPASATGTVPSPLASDPGPARPPADLPTVPGIDAFGSFLRHGLHHVLTGYDHLLFLAALALATTTWKRLLGIIGIFTLAHSITVTLAAVGWVRLPPSIVEPVIAGSIVFVALQNVLAPSQASGIGRLAVAFGFGLVHGLGFAGGLRESLTDSPPASLALVILAFCIGVELGHLAVGAPLFGILRALRRTPPSESVTPTVTGIERWGSVGVALGGSWFLWAALRSI